MKIIFMRVKPLANFCHPYHVKTQEGSHRPGENRTPGWQE